MTTHSDEFLIADIPAKVRSQIYAHVLTNADHEVGGVLVGTVDGRTGQPRVVGAIEALEAVGEAASVTFTHEAWEEVLAIQEEEFPSTQIVGWYHSHPGFGIFLSEHDLFIHRNFFSDAHQFAYVVDPVARTEGLFCWHSGDLALVDQRQLDGAMAEAAVSGTASSVGRLSIALEDLDDFDPPAPAEAAAGHATSTAAATEPVRPLRGVPATGVAVDPAARGAAAMSLPVSGEKEGSGIPLILAGSAMLIAAGVIAALSLSSGGDAPGPAKPGSTEFYQQQNDQLSRLSREQQTAEQQVTAAVDEARAAWAVAHRPKPVARPKPKSGGTSSGPSAAPAPAPKPAPKQPSQVQSSDVFN